MEARPSRNVTENQGKDSKAVSLCCKRVTMHGQKEASIVFDLKGPHPVQPARSPIVEDVAVDEFRYH